MPIIFQYKINNFKKQMEYFLAKTWSEKKLKTLMDRYTDEIGKKITYVPLGEHKKKTNYDPVVHTWVLAFKRQFQLQCKERHEYFLS